MSGSKKSINGLSIFKVLYSSYKAGLCCLLLMAINFAVSAQSLIAINNEKLIICPTQVGDISQPTFLEADCKAIRFNEIDPQNTDFWLKAELDVPADYLAQKQPSALYVFGKMSSTVYFNSELLGTNGTPSPYAKNEYVGNMDANFYVPPELIKVGKNQVVAYVSSHHGLLTLKQPVHFIGLGEFGDTKRYFKQNLLVSLILFGALIIGAIYLAALTFHSTEKKSPALLCFMAIIASGQLFAESARGLINYSYPMHDFRLIVIVVLAFIFGQSLVLYSLYKNQQSIKKRWLLASIIMTLSAVWWLDGYDIKTAICIMIPVIFSLILAFKKYQQHSSQSHLINLVIYGVFTIIIVATVQVFHAMYFYYLLTIMMAFLMVRQAHELGKEQLKRQQEQQQLAKLQFKLDQLAQQHTPSKLTISSAGKTDLLATESILYCKAAGDYVDIFLSDHQHSLYSGSLKSLEGQLPSTFLKVHRSYIVNLDHIVAIKSNKPEEGSGAILLLSDDSEVPVSRRILPTVRNAVRNPPL